MAKHSPKSNFDRIVERMVANSFSDMHVVRELGPGEYFGDLAITNNTNRFKLQFKKIYINLHYILLNE
jgi:hypothetical protein